jgi:hypothetical protein
MSRLNILILVLLVSISFGCETKKEDKTQNVDLPPLQTLNTPEQDQRVNQKQPNIDPKTDEEVLAVVYENLEGTKAEDKERVLATIHKDSPQYKSTVQGLDFVFTNYDLEFSMEKTEVLEAGENDAKVYYVLTMRSIKGRGFLNKRDEGIHHLKKQDGKWRIFKTENISTVPIQ